MKARALALAFLFLSATAFARPDCATALATPALEAWAQQHRQHTRVRGFLTWPMVLETVSAIAPNVRDAMFDVGRCIGPDCRWFAQAQIEAQGLSTADFDPLALVVDRLVAASYTDSRRSPWESVRQELDAHEQLPAEERRLLREKIALRYRVHLAVERFADRGHQYYRARLEGRELVFPDGARRKVTRGWWGHRYVWVPYRDVIRTQEFEHPGIVARYRENAWVGYWGFEAYLAPDGRAVIIDQHHRTTAYAQRNAKRGTRWEDTLLPIRLEPRPDGSLPTLTHWSILASAHCVPLARNSLRWRDPEWSFLKPEARDALLYAAELDDWISEVRRWYAESTGLQPVLE